MWRTDSMMRRGRGLLCAWIRTAATAMLAVGIWTVLVPVAAASRDCLSAFGEEAVVACRTALLTEPANLAIRMALGDALMATRQYDQAVTVLRAGFEYFPGDDRLKRKLTVAESYRDERQWMEAQQREGAAARAASDGNQVRLSVIRCSRLSGDAALAACNEGLEIAPDHSELRAGRGRVWLEMDRVGDAVLDFQAALATDPRNRQAAEGLVLAQARRTQKATQCLQSDGPEGLDACDAALLPGAPDAFAILKRRAEVLHGMGNREAALAAYQTAAGLNPGDNDIVRALAMLTPPAHQPTSRTAVNANGTEALTNRPSVRDAPPYADGNETPSAERSVPPSTTSAAAPYRPFSNAPVTPGVTH